MPRDRIRLGRLADACAAGRRDARRGQSRARGAEGGSWWAAYRAGFLDERKAMKRAGRLAQLELFEATA